MDWDVRVPRRVSKVFRRFPQKDRDRILEILRDFKMDPWQGDIVKISGEENLWRKRAGSYRIFYSVEVKLRVVEIKEIERRTSKTY